MYSRKIELDIIKIFACYLVIVSHITCLPFFINADITSTTWNISNLFYNARSSCVPLFLMVSGVLYLNPDYEIGIKKITKLCIKMLLIYLIWNFMYSFFDTSTKNPIEIIKTMIFSPPGHLWYLPMLIGVYLLLPLLKQISNNEKTLRYYLIFWIFLAILKFSLMSIFNVIPLPVVTNIINTSFTRFRIDNLSIFSGYLLLGHYLYLHNTKLKLWELIVVLICSVFIGTAITFWGTHTIGTLYTDPTDWMFFTSFLQSCSIYLIFLKLNMKFKNKISVAVKNNIYFLSKLTFGIYLVHAFFTAKCFPYLRGGLTLLEIPIFALFIFAISAIIVYILKKIPIVKLCL